MLSEQMYLLMMLLMALVLIVFFIVLIVGLVIVLLMSLVINVLLHAISDAPSVVPVGSRVDSDLCELGDDAGDVAVANVGLDVDLLCAPPKRQMWRDNFTFILYLIFLILGLL